MTYRHRSARASRAGARGAALAVGLVLLTMLTLLAISAFGTATAELAMAGNEQYRRSAALAASAGIEAAIAAIGTIGTLPAGPPVAVEDVAIAGSHTDTYSTLTRFAGEESVLPQSSAGKFVGLHFLVESTGRSRRAALEVQTQGVLVIAPSGGAQSHGRIGAGLAP